VGVAFESQATAQNDVADANNGGENSASSTPPASNLIVVTARKREESLVDVPLSISVVSGDQLDAFAIRDVQSAARLVPNVYLDEVTAGPRVSIRGLGNAQTGGVVDSSVGLGIDGVYFGRPRWLQAGLFDVEGIEVLRGPQSTYFGRNTTAGLINIRTRGPTDELSSYLNAGYDFELDNYQFEGAIGGPIHNDVGVRIAYRHGEGSGYLRVIETGEVTPDSNEDILRLTVAYEPAAGFDATYTFTYFDDFENGNSQEVGACGAAFLAALSAAGSAEDCQLNNRKAQDVAVPGGFLPREFFTHNQGWAHSLGINIPVGNLTLSSVTGYNRLETDWNSDGDWGALSFFAVNRPELYRQLSQELRLQSDASRPISFIVGGYYDHVRRRMNQDLDAGPPFGSFSLTRLLEINADSYAAFGEVTWMITPELSITAGGRYTDVSQDGRLTQEAGPLGNPTGIIGFIPDYDILDRIDTSDFSPSVTLQYSFDDVGQIYASYKEGFKSGGFDLDNSAGVGSFNYGDESAESYELGARFDLVDRSLLLSVALFRTNVTDLQVQSFTGTGPTAIILNAASARMQGGELELSYRPTSPFSGNLSFGYTDAEYRSFLLAPCTTGQIASGFCTIRPGAPAPTQDLSGQRLPLAPQFSASAELNYRYPIFDAYDLALGANVTHRSSVFLNIENDPLTRSGSLTLVDARIAFEPNGNSGFSAALIGRNIFNEQYMTGAVSLPFPNSFVYDVGLPRSIEAQVGFRF